MDSLTALEELIRLLSAKAVAAKDEGEWQVILDEPRVAVHEYTEQARENLLASYPLDPT
jgi:hypothetical protein